MKSIFKSKTVWLNTVLTAIGIAAFLQTQPFSARTLEVFIVVTGILNIINRIWFTSQPIA